MRRPRYRLVVLDLDEVLWDHPDVSSLRLPVRRVSDHEVVDSEGDVVRLRPGVREFLEAAKRAGLYLATCSWNDFRSAKAVLDAFGLTDLFDLLVIEPHPEKERMMGAILRHFSELGVGEEEVVFIDDRREMLERVGRRFGEVGLLRFHPEGDVKSFEELLEILGLKAQI